jgi:hypothetical protein
MSVHRVSAAGCVLSDGRFAVFGGTDGEGVETASCDGRFTVFGGKGGNNVRLASCEVLTLDGDDRWESLPPMRDARCGRVRRRRRRS